jgi:hypothetical protein
LRRTPALNAPILFIIPHFSGDILIFQICIRHEKRHRRFPTAVP